MMLMIVYEDLLADDPTWALKEGSMHFDEGSAVHKTLVKLVKRLDELKIPYAIVGAMAMFFHGYRRFTEDVDVLVTPDALARIHQELVELGYVSLFKGSKNLRDAEHGVRIEFLVAGQYPGDGKPKPVAFPPPEGFTVDIAGIQCLQLAKLIELKLASGTTPGRRRDLADVQELIRTLKLPSSFADVLDSSVRRLYDELWMELQNAPPTA